MHWRSYCNSESVFRVVIQSSIHVSLKLSFTITLKKINWYFDFLSKWKEYYTWVSTCSSEMYSFKSFINRCICVHQPTPIPPFFIYPFVFSELFSGLYIYIYVCVCVCYFLKERTIIIFEKLKIVAERQRKWDRSIEQQVCIFNSNEIIWTVEHSTLMNCSNNKNSIIY